MFLFIRPLKLFIILPLLSIIITSPNQHESTYLKPSHSWPYSSYLFKLSKTAPEMVSQFPLQQANNTNVTPNDKLSMGAPRKRVCYFRMDPKTEIRLSQVDGSLCTHVIMAFVRLDHKGTVCLAREEDLSYLLEIPDFKRRFPGVKVMVSVFNELEYDGFPKAAFSLENRQQFARSAMQFLQHFHLDGLDLDWEFPNFPTSLFSWNGELERSGLTKILKTLRSAIVENFFDRQLAQQRSSQQPAATTGYTSGGKSNMIEVRLQLKGEVQVEPYLLTVALAAQDAVLKASYELNHVANLCDWLNVMSYDYFLFKLYAPLTGPNSPLNSLADPIVPIVSKLSFSWTVNKLIEDGVDRHKIVMGIPTYARAYKLAFRQTHPSPFTLALGAKGGGRIEDYLDYREVLELLSKRGTKKEFDQRARVPYLLADDGYTWVSYEDPQSVREKVKHVFQNDLGGYMTWNLNSDDFLGHIKEEDQSEPVANGHSAIQLQDTFPLHRAMFNELNRLEASTSS